MALNEFGRFLRRAIAHPRKVGAIAPSSPALARVIAAQVDPALPGKILELGPGTGVVTEALIKRGVAPERIVAVEYDSDFAALVEKRCPGVRVVRGDAFDLDTTLGRDAKDFAGIVSGLPLLNHTPDRRRILIEDALRRLKPGAPYVQFSYGLQPAIPGTSRYSVTRAAVIWHNLPPARVWIYRSK
jgi:phosphatidylethanolamine/phosphatidyl-N-methylethanolamine N-methyltransferase